jgi:hypothetical protein
MSGLQGEKVGVQRETIVKGAAIRWQNEQRWVGETSGNELTKQAAMGWQNKR